MMVTAPRLVYIQAHDGRLSGAVSRTSVLIEQAGNS